MKNLSFSRLFTVMPEKFVHRSCKQLIRFQLKVTRSPSRCPAPSIGGNTANHETFQKLSAKTGGIMTGFIEDIARIQATLFPELLDDYISEAGVPLIQLHQHRGESF